VSTLESISLDELVAEAALLTRVDRKYVVPRVEAGRLLAVVDPATRVLEIDGSRASAYESVYFDTPDLLSYRMAALARRRRFKLRTRSYLDSREAWLEMKTRGARSTTVKERVPHDFAAATSLDRAARSYADEALEAIGLPDPAGLYLVPTLVTRYDRTTLLQPDGARATIDVDLSWEGDDGQVLTRPGLAIVETKSGSRTSGLDRLLWSRGYRPTSISKFGTGLAALRPDLPSNRWARVIRRHFQEAA